MENNTVDAVEQVDPNWLDPNHQNISGLTCKASRGTVRS